MKLYDSYGNITDKEVKDIKIYSAKDTDWINEIRYDINECIKETSGSHKEQWSFKLNNNRLYMHAQSEFDKKERVSGIVFYYNPADGELCRMSHFSCTKENWDQNRLGSMFSTNTFPKYLRQSLEEEKKYPEIQTIMEKLSEKYELDKKDGYSYNKNMYILTNNLKSRLNVSGMVWNTFNEIKKVSGISGARYNGNIITFNQNGESYNAVISGRISCNGNIYSSIDDYISALKSGDCKMNVSEYGHDESFLSYVKTGEMPEEEKEQDEPER